MNDLNVLTSKQEEMLTIIEHIKDKETQKNFIATLLVGQILKNEEKQLETIHYSLKKVFKRFEQNQDKPVTIQDLKKEVTDIKKEIK